MITLDQIPQDVMSEINRLSAIIINTVDPQSIFLFGSYARGDFRSDSDIDLLVTQPHYQKSRHDAARIYELSFPQKKELDIIFCSEDSPIGQQIRQKGVLLYANK